MPTPPQTGTVAVDPADRDGVPDIDNGVLDRLIALIGPDAAPEFMARLLADLRRADAGIGLALQRPDPAELRRHSHILMGLAGAVGATRVLHLAQDLNRMANAEADAALRGVAAAVRTEVALLIETVIARDPATVARP